MVVDCIVLDKEIAITKINLIVYNKIFNDLVSN